MSEKSENDQKTSRWSRLKRRLKSGAKKLAIVAASWAVSSVFPPAGAALYSFLKSRITGSPFTFNIGDEILKTLCTETLTNRSINYLQKKLEELVKKSETSQSLGLTDEQIQLTVGSIIRPLSDSLNDALGYIREFPDQIHYLIEEWKAENEGLMKELKIDINEGFDELQALVYENFSELNKGLNQIIRQLTRIETSMNNTLATGTKQIFSSETITQLDLRIISKAQLSMAHYSSRFDIAFEPDLFIIREEADSAISDFIVDFTSEFPTGRHILLVLAGAGMGKTWTLASWGHRLSESAYPEEKSKIFIPFFISLDYNLDVQLKGYFGANYKHDVLRNLRTAKEMTGFVPILFIDGLDEINPDEIRGTLRFILDLSQENIPVILSCRDSDWSREERIIEMHSLMKNHCFDHIAGDSYGVKDVSCLPSIYLGAFTEEEFLAAIERYQIPLTALYTPQLREMAKRPILLKLFANYFKKEGKIPNPADPTEFQPLFLGKKGDIPETHILGRIGIIGTKRDYLVRIVRRFLEIGYELTGNQLSDLVQDNENFKLIRSSGLLKEEWDPIGTIFMLDPLFRPHLEHLVNLADEHLRQRFKIEEVSPPPKPQVVSPPPKPQVVSPPPKLKEIPPVLEPKRALVDLLDRKILSELEIYLGEEIPEITNDEKFGYIRENKNIIELKLSSKGLTELPEDVGKLSSLQNINLTSNQLNELPESIGNLNSLQNVILYGNRLSKLPESFGNLMSLRTLELGYNRISELPKFIGNLNSLVTLDLKGNQLIALPESIGNIKWLKVLELKSNQLIELPDSIGEMTSLTTLDLCWNQLKTLPESLGNLLSLEKLDLSANQFTIIPNSIGNLKALKEIDLKGNKLLSLPESIGNLSSLESLDLYGNRLKTLPESMGNLESLKTFDVRYNRLINLPESSSYLQSFTTLDFTGNRLESIASSIGNLKSLMVLILEKNKLRELPSSIGNLKSLKTLNLIDNNLISLPESFGNLKNLQYLSLTNNNLKNIPESFGKLKSLNTITLNNNQLEELPDSFGNLVSLQFLNLKQNQLRKLPDSIGKLNIEMLSLSNNKLINLPDSIGNLKGVSMLNLGGNLLLKLPNSIGKLQNLNTLYLNDNQLKELPESIGNLQNLETIKLNNNQLREVPDSIGMLTSLRSLNVKNNQLKELPESIGDMKFLNLLNLQGNQLKKVPYFIKKLKSLESLYLAENNLTDLPNFLLKLPNLKIISIDENPFSDKDKISRMKMQLKARNVIIREKPYY